MKSQEHLEYIKFEYVEHVGICEIPGISSTPKIFRIFGCLNICKWCGISRIPKQ